MLNGHRRHTMLRAAGPAAATARTASARWDRMRPRTGTSTVIVPTQYGCLFKTTLPPHGTAPSTTMAVKVSHTRSAEAKRAVGNRIGCDDVNLEAKLLGRLADPDYSHPNLTYLHPRHQEVIAAPGTSVLVTPFFTGGSLWDAQGGSGAPALLSRTDVVEIVRGVAAGLHHLHTRLGYAHLDLSPDNVMLHRLEGGGVTCAVVIDLGCAVSLRACRRPMTATGKRLYRAPELVTPQSWNDDPRVADVFSLGFMFLELLVGRARAEELRKGGKRQMIEELEQRHRERCSADTAKLVVDMISLYACDRPSMKDVLARLPPRTLATAPAAAAGDSSHEARTDGEHTKGGNTDGMDVMAATDPSTLGPSLSEAPPPPVECGDMRGDLNTLNAIGDDGQGSHHRTEGEGGGTGPDAHAKRGRSVEEAVLRIGGVTCGGSEGVATPSAAKRRRCE